MKRVIIALPLLALTACDNHVAGYLTEAEICAQTQQILEQKLGETFSTMENSCKASGFGYGDIEVEAEYLSFQGDPYHYSAHGFVNGTQVSITQLTLDAIDPDNIPLQQASECQLNGECRILL